MSNEYIITKKYTRDEIKKINYNKKLSLETSNESNFISQIMGGTISAFSLMFLASKTLSAATAVAGLLHDTVTSIPSSRDLIENGHSQLQEVQMLV